MPVKVQCPNPACGKAGSVADEQVGQPVQCPYCRTRFTIAGPGGTVLPQGTVTPYPVAQGLFPPSGTLDAPDPQRIGRFQIRARLGAGAFGTVYRAYDPHLEREVALKVPREGTLDSPQRIARFLREARAAARLQHPHIVGLYEAGQDSGRHYIASAFIKGQTLAEVLDAGALDCRRAARLVRDLAEALAYAHEQGVVHRDVKPANVMIDARDRPHLMDFGLAHQQDSARKLTQIGAILGTPAYMAPEQAAGASGEARAASDQYSLGVLFYELLCGQTPFTGPPEIVLFNHIHQQPAPPRQHNPHVPQALEAVCLQALAKRPEDRYSGCQDLADALKQWLEPGVKSTQALPGRRRRLALGAAALAAPLFLGSIALWVALAAGPSTHEDEDPLPGREHSLRDDAGRRTAAEAERKTRELAAAKARLAQQQKELEAARADLARKEKQQEIEAASAALAKKQREMDAAKDKLTKDEPKRPAETVVPKPSPTPAVIWKKVFSFTPKGGSLSGPLSFSADGKIFATTTQVNNSVKVRLWQVGGWQLAVLPFDDIVQMAFSPKENLLATSAAGNSIKLWNPLSGKLLATLSPPLKGTGQFFFSPDGKLLAQVCSEGNRPADGIHWEQPHLTLQLWKLDSRKPLWALPDHCGWIRCLAFAPNGKLLATAETERRQYRLDPMQKKYVLVKKTNPRVRVWDLDSGKARFTFERQAPVTGLWFSPEGKKLVLREGEQQEERRSYLLDLSGKQVLASARLLVFSPDGKTLAAVTQDPKARANIVQLLDGATGKIRFTVAAKFDRVPHMLYSSNGKTLAAIRYDPHRLDRVVWLLDGATGKIRANFDKVTLLAFSPDGKMLALAGERGVQVIGTAGGKELARCEGKLIPGNTLRFSPDGDTLLGNDWRGTVTLWAVPKK